MPKTPSAPESPAPPRPKKKRRWWKVLLVLLLLLGVAAALINGPAARWFLGKTIREQLAKQGLTGEVTVEGRLWSGFTLRDVSFSGADAIRSLAFDNVGVRYRLPELRDKKIEGLFGRDISVVIRAAADKKPENPEKPDAEPDFAAVTDLLRKARALALPVALDFEKISVTYLQPDKDPLELAVGAIEHAAGSDEFLLGAIRSNALGDEGLPEQDLTLTWRDESLGLSRLTLLPDLSVANLQARFPENNLIELTSAISAAGANLDLTVDKNGSLRAELTGDPLDLAALSNRFFPEEDLQGAVRKFVLTAAGLTGPREEWTGAVDLATDAVTWRGRQFPPLEATARVDEQLDLSATTAGGITAKVQSRDDDFAARPPSRWFKDLPVSFDLSLPRIHAALRELLPATGAELPDLEQIPDAAFSVSGRLTAAGERPVDSVEAAWTGKDIAYRGTPVPGLHGELKFFGDITEVSATLTEPRPEESLELTAQYNLAAKAYRGSLTTRLPDPAWLNPLLPGDNPLWKPTGPMALTWSGEGALEEKTHRGALDVADLSLLAPEATVVDARTTASYQWPGTVKAESLSIQNGDLWLEGSAGWEEDRLTIGALRLHDATGPLATLQGGTPLAADTRSLPDFLKQDGPLDLRLTARELRLARLAKLLPMPPALEGYTAILSGDLTLGGTPGAPTVAGQLRASEVRVPAPEKLPVVAAEIRLTTEGRQLLARGSVTEPGGKILDLDASLPLQLKESLEDPDRLKSLPLEANATITSFALPRLQIFAPQLADADGTIDGNFTVKGPVSKPVLSGGASVALKRYPLPGTPFREVRDATLVVNLDGDRIVVPPSPLTIAGGKLVLSGAVTPFGEEPILDLRLDADHALLWRDQNLSARANAALTLKGPLSAARLAGTVDVVESLFYKDIELIPFGLPPASAPAPELPKIGRVKREKLINVPAPLADWPLDIRVRTADPFLVRGNLANGSVRGDATVTGTLANPRPDGQIVISELTAELPFSTLGIKRGIITLRPEAPLDPALEIRGTSTVQAHLIQLYLFGPLSNPKYSLVSSPPLPENEILTLLATGTTVGDLNDPELARMRAFQLVLADLRLKASQPEANALLRAARPVLDASSSFDLRVGDNDPFSGRQFNSATIQLFNKWFATIQVDALGQTRGLLRYSVRSRR